jgi:2-methylcitrate dehydratase PrpD
MEKVDTLRRADPAGDTARLAEFAAGLRYEDIPAPVLERARNTMCDTVGAIVFGYGLPWSQMIVDYAAAYGRGGPSRILGPGGPAVQPPMAALANGALAHAFELDGATKPSAGVHPSAIILPAILVIAQERNLSGRDLMTAFVAGTEVVVRVGRATRRTNEARGFHAPGTSGPFGAAVAVGRLLGFDAAKMTNAIGIAGSLASGLVQFSRSKTGGMVKRLHFGRASEGGVLAASLAARGFTGPHNVLEGELGFLNAFCNSPDASQLTRGLGEDYLVMSIYMKRYACHGQAQIPLQALEDLRAEHRFTADDVESIVVLGSEDLVDRHDLRNPPDPMLAQYSVPFSVAVSFFRDPRDPRSFDHSAIADPRIKALIERIRLGHEDAAKYGSKAASVTVTLKDGRLLSRRLSSFKGTPEAPPSREDVREKFMLLTRDCPSAKMNEIFDRLQGVEQETTFDWLSF